MKYAVTGGLGFIGSNICRLLLKKGHQVIIIDNCHSGNETKILDIIDELELHKNSTLSPTDKKACVLREAKEFEKYIVTGE